MCKQEESEQASGEWVEKWRERRGQKGGERGRGQRVEERGQQFKIKRENCSATK